MKYIITEGRFKGTILVSNAPSPYRLTNYMGYDCVITESDHFMVGEKIDSEALAFTQADYYTDHPEVKEPEQVMVPITIMCDPLLASAFMGYMSDGGGEYGFFDAATDATDGKYTANFKYSTVDGKRTITIEKVLNYQDE